MYIHMREALRGDRAKADERATQDLQIYALYNVMLWFVYNLDVVSLLLLLLIYIYIYVQ